MATVTGMKAERMLEIEANSVVDGDVNGSGHLILKTRGGSDIDAGSVIGPVGPSPRYTIPSLTPGVQSYVKLAEINGVAALSGAHLSFILSGLGGYGSTSRTTVLVHVGQRGVNGIELKAWSWGSETSVTPIELFTRQISDFVFEIWGKFAQYTFQAGLTELSNFRGTISISSITTTEPVGAVPWPIRNSEVPVATSAEVEIGTDDEKIITPLALAPFRKKVNDRFDFLRLTRDFPTQMFDVKSVLTSQFKTYDEHTRLMVNVDYGQPAFFLSENGWVTARGLLKTTSATSAGQVICVIPPEYRPQTIRLVPCYVADSVVGTYSIEIRPNGEVRLAIAALVNTDISLANVVYNVNASTDVALQSPYTAYQPATFGNPGYYRSPDGVVTFVGAFKDGVTSNSTAMSVPSIARALSTIGDEQHYIVANTNGGFTYANLGVASNPGTYKARNPVLTQHMAGNVTVSDGELTNKHLLASYINSWATYPSMPAAQAWKTADGMVILAGLLTGGVVGAGAFFLPPGWRPRRTIIRRSVSNDAGARLDIRADGAVIPILGSNTWFSIDGVMFAAEQ